MSLVPFDETSLSQGIGGAQTWCISLAEQLACMSHDVVVLAQCCCKHFSNNVLWIPLSKVLQNGGHFFISYLDKMNFDVILVSRPTQSLLEMVNSIHSNVYVVYHGTKEGVTTYCEALKSRNIRKIVALTSWHRKYMISEMGISENKIEVIPNGIRMEDFMYLDAEHDVDHTILWSSEPLRGLNVLTQSLLPNLKKYISDIKVDVALPLYVKADFIDNDINYLGHLSKHDLYSNMNRHAVWFYPSIYRETFCITAIETVMCGNMPVLPVLYGPEDIFGGFGKVGMANDFVESYDDAVEEATDKICDAILNYKEPSKIRLRRDLKKFVASNFTWSMVADRYVRIFEDSL